MDAGRSQRLAFSGDDVEDVVLFGAAHGVGAFLFDFFEVLDVEVCEKLRDLLAREVAFGADAGPVVAVAEKLAGESALGGEGLLDP